MNLVIDIGNTYTKIAVFKEKEIVKALTVKQLDDITITSLLGNYSISKRIYTSVANKKDNRELLKKHNFLPLSHLTPLPLKIKYQTPETLGLDRICAVAGAKCIFKENNLLVIDMGTCITYDFIKSNHFYMGGSISPGFQMRFKALQHFTGKLPLVNFAKDKLALIGNTTEKSILSGVYNGMKNEINGIISSYLLQYEDLKVVVTGGDRNLFDLEPKNRIFANEFLVLKGLNEILDYNE